MRPRFLIRDGVVTPLRFTVAMAGICSLAIPLALVWTALLVTNHLTWRDGQ